MDARVGNLGPKTNAHSALQEVNVTREGQHAGRRNPSAVPSFLMLRLI